MGQEKAHGKQVSVGKSGRQWADGYLRLQMNAVVRL